MTVHLLVRVTSTVSRLEVIKDELLLKKLEPGDELPADCVLPGSMGKEGWRLVL